MNSQRKMLAVLAQIMSQETNVAQEVTDLQTAMAAMSLQITQLGTNLQQVTAVNTEVTTDIQAAVSKLKVTPINPADIEAVAVALQTAATTLAANNKTLATTTTATQTVAQQLEAAMNPPPPAKP